MELQLDKLVERLKQAEVLTHYWHLRTKSYARHLALGGFYEALQDMTDGIAECVQGKLGTRVTIPAQISLNEPEDHEAYFNNLGDFIDMYIMMYNKDLELQDHLLGIRNLINKSLYLFTLS